MKNFTEFLKALPSLFVIGILIFIGIYGYGMYKDIIEEQKESKQKIDTINHEIIKLGNTVYKSRTNRLKKEDLERVVDKKIKKLMKESDEEPTERVEVKGEIHGSTSTPEVETNKDQKKAYLKWPPKNGTSIILGNIRFYLEEEKILSETYPISFNLQVVKSVNKEGTENVYGSLVAEGPVKIEGDTIEKGKYPIPISKLKVQERYPDKHSWHKKNHIDAGGSAKFTENPQIGFSLGITPFAYGKTEDDNLVRLPRVSIAGNEEDFWMSIQAGYNLGENIPNLSDTWIYVGPCMDIQSNVGGCLDITSTF